MDKGTNQIELSTSAKAAGKSTAPSTVLNHGKTYERRYQNQTGDSTAVQVAALQIYITERDWTHDGFVSEFRKVPNETSSMHVSKHRTSWPKNRYCNLWTYDYNRVLLDSGEDGPLDYINASHVTGYNGRAYVAAQGPIETTVVDTWRMIWKLKTNRVVMLTKLFHCGMNVCEIYWPPHAGTHKDFGMFEVTTLSCDICSDYTIRTFLVTCQLPLSVLQKRTVLPPLRCGRYDVAALHHPTKPMSYLGWTCQANNSLIYRSANNPEAEKSDPSPAARVTPADCAREEVTLHSHGKRGHGDLPGTPVTLSAKKIGLHQSITLNFLVAAHTKFSIDWCFGLLKQAFKCHAVLSLSEFESVVCRSVCVNTALLVSCKDRTSLLLVGNWKPM